MTRLLLAKTRAVGASCCDLAWWWAQRALVLFPVFALAAPPAPPPVSAAYRVELVRSARSVWGLDAPIATLAAQVHQESAWNPRAVSHVGAAGLAQFMPATSSWISRIDPQLAANEPFNPTWSLRALASYDLWLHERVAGRDGCQRFAMVLSAYNGGLGWVNRDKALAARQGLDPLLWFGSVETVNAGRAPGHWRENRDYPRRILLRHERTYVDAGWGRGVCT
ncbi:transglycosylase SLT domain-containing protein [Caldimonas sp. KR1-144]|uniref:transglycosylase SLT domain-containing protein n=1 Tax=Caldimonas sp. KR1-144 TaxID=3400911 RepID=UPI003C0B334C